MSPKNKPSKAIGYILFKYEATDEKGKVVNGQMRAENKKEVVEYLMGLDLISVSIEKQTYKKERRAHGLQFVLFETVTPMDRILLVRNLATSIKAGLNIIEAIDILLTDVKKQIMRNILLHAKTNLQSGQPLHATFNFYKKHFPPFFIGMLKAGEASGNLDKILKEISDYLIREYNLVRKVKSSLAYPVILLFASTAVITLLLAFVLPRLTKVFERSGAELPLVTRALIGVSNIITYSWILDLAVVAFFIWLFTYFRKTDFGRRLFMKILFRVPVVKDLVRKLALVRFTRASGSLISSGLPIIESLMLSAESVGNDIYKAAILDSLEHIKKGVPLSKVLELRPDLFPHFLTSLVLVGEKTGTLENIFETFADFYDEEVDYAFKNLTSFLEPILLLVMGGIVATIVLAILLPIYQFVGGFS